MTDTSIIQEPAPSEFGLIVVTPDNNCRKAVDTAIAKVSNLSKVGERISESATRSMYRSESARLIVNVPAKHMTEALGNHVAVLALSTDDPARAAEVFAASLASSGLEVQIHYGLESELPVLTFVTTLSLPGLAFLMWPRQRPAILPPIQ